MNRNNLINIFFNPLYFLKRLQGKEILLEQSSCNLVELRKFTNKLCFTFSALSVLLMENELFVENEEREDT